MNIIEPFIPHYLRKPNTFLRYETERFIGSHYSATLNVAYFLDKKGKEQRCVAQVIWDQDAWK